MSNNSEPFTQAFAFMVATPLTVFLSAQVGQV